MVSEFVKNIYNEWLEDNSEIVDDVVGISENDHEIILYCLRTPAILSSFCLKDLKTRFGSIDYDDERYDLIVRLIDVYEDPECRHLPVMVKMFEGFKDSSNQQIKDISDIIINWASLYTRSDNFKISFSMRSAMMSRKTRRMSIAVDVYSLDNFLTLDPEESSDKLKKMLSRKYPRYDFRINIYEAFTSII